MQEVVKVLWGLAVGVGATDCTSPQETWDYIRYLDQDIAAVSPLPREGRELLYQFWHSLGSDPANRAENSAKCAPGMAAVMLHSLSFIDRDEGEAAAAEVYRQAERLVNSLRGWSGWRVNLTWHEAAPKLLGLEPLPDAQLCAEEHRPRFYVYDTGDYARPLLSCASGMEGSEVMLHRFLLRSRCRTRDPAEADFFYVPFYSFCFQNLHIKPGTETEELDKHNIAVVNSLEHFDVYRRRQHIFHFAHEFWDFPSWESYVARAKIFAVEANPLIDVVNYRHCVSCFDAWKDVVVPGHTDAWAMRKLREKGKPSTERRFRFCFHGAMRHDLYERTHAEGRPFNGSRAADTRRQIQAFAGESDASIGPHITPLLDYYGRVGDCIFCLVPKGVGYTNGRLFEAFFAGCIPVILSDAMVVPFQAFLPWPDFSMKLPMDDVARAVHLLRAMPSARIAQMQESLLENACWFDYYSQDPSCSPYEGVLRVLEMQQDRPHREVFGCKTHLSSKADTSETVSDCGGVELLDPPTAALLEIGRLLALISSSSSSSSNFRSVLPAASRATARERLPTWQGRLSFNATTSLTAAEPGAASQLLIASLAIGTCNVAVAFVRGFQGCSQAPSRKARSAVLAGEQLLTVAVLKEKLREKGLSTTGRKQELLERLEGAERQPAAGYAKLTVAQLKAKCAELDLPKSGRKADLVARLEAKAASQASHSTASSKFLVGDRVMALYEKEQKEYEALVQCHNGDESYLITWTEDGYEHNQDASNMRLLKRRDKPFRFSAGDKVEGLFHDEDRWYAARVKCVNDSGSYTVIWDEDGEEYELAEKDLKPSKLPTPLSDLTPRQKLTGTVARTFGFGTFVDIGAERDGLLKPWFTFKGEEPSFKPGDKVKALYDEEEEYYAATVQKDNGDGTFDIVWEEDDCEYTADKSKMELVRLAELEWMPPETGLQLSASLGRDDVAVVHWPALGSVEVDRSAGVVRLQGQTLGKVRRVPNWWGEDANLASGVLVAAETAEGVEFLLAVESRPWWPTRQVGPLWGFVEAEDPSLTFAMAREAAEEGLEILGSQDQLLASLESSETSCPVSFWPWESDTARLKPRPAVLRMVSLGRLSPMQKGAVLGSFRKRRRHALAWAASLAVLAQPASHLEVEELIWVNSRSLLQEVQAGQVPWLGGSEGGPLRGFVGDLLREGQRWKRSARFRDFCTGTSEAEAWQHQDIECVTNLHCAEAVTVYVESVKTDKDGQQKLWLALVKDKIGSQGPKPIVDLSGFTDLSTDLWLRGTVTKILNFGAFVRVEPPTGGEPAQGLVHVNEVRDGFIKNLEVLPLPILASNLLRVTYSSTLAHRYARKKLVSPALLHFATVHAPRALVASKVRKPPRKHHGSAEMWSLNAIQQMQRPTEMSPQLEVSAVKNSGSATVWNREPVLGCMRRAHCKTFVPGRLIEVQLKLLMPVAENLKSEIFPPVRIDVDYFAAGFFLRADDLEPSYLHSRTCKLHKGWTFKLSAIGIDFFGSCLAPRAFGMPLAKCCLPANLAVCFVSFRYLKQLREAEEASYQEAELDLSKLYEVPPGYEKTKAEPPFGDPSDFASKAPGKSLRKAEPIPATRTEAESTTLPSNPEPPKPAAMPKPPATSPQKPPPQKQATEPPTLPPHEHPLQMTSTCPICGARKESPLLTTNLDLDVRCTWKEVSKSFLSETADDGQPKALSDAKEICINIGTSCGGVTCDKPGTHLEEAKQCTARSSTQPKSSPSEEVTFVKNCTYGSTCDEARPTRFPANPFSKDLKGAAIVILAHNREGDFRRCLESLFAIPEVALFTVYISLDDPAAWTSMTAAAKQVAAGKGINIEVWQIGPRAFDATTVLNEETDKWMKTNTGKIAHHYWTVFEKSFMEKAHDHVIFVEEDLLFSPDFFALFRSTAGLLDEDPSLWCIGAWNDFGFKGTALDACSLQRTSYFPGLGFMLLRRAWLEVRKAWPLAPTMGWDYWMRVAFRAAGKECIVPQVSRSHHAAAKGSSVSTAKQIRLFESMAFSDVPSTCDVAEPCAQFGNVSYLAAEDYDAWHRQAVAKAPRLDLKELKAQNGKPIKKLPKILHVVPYVHEEFLQYAEAAGLSPRNTKGSIPADVRSEHYGTVVGRIVSQQVPLLMVDKRSQLGLLRPEEQLRFNVNFEVVPGSQGKSCVEVCQARNAKCDKQQIYFLNDCNLLKKHFPCEAGCAHQVGKELPVYVPDPAQSTKGQCLITFISPATCEAKHKSTSRLCPCSVAAKAETVRPGHK
ncbi:Mgat1 [Symbiodinium sp. CCMP2456]|nr:Mgat1 [Symbiodinium sp. CCMP2456]